MDNLLSDGKGNDSSNAHTPRGSGRARSGTKFAKSSLSTGGALRCAYGSNHCLRLNRID